MMRATRVTLAIAASVWMLTPLWAAPKADQEYLTLLDNYAGGADISSWSSVE
jgi:hypothetical protein